MYQLITFDMDGTLLSSKKEIIPSTRQAFEAAAEANKLMIVSTGRATVELASYRQELAHFSYGILASGGLLYDFKAEKILQKHSISPEIVKQISQLGKSRDIMIQAMRDGQIYLQRSHFEKIHRYHMTPYRELYVQSAIFVKDITDILDASPSEFEKINLFHQSPALRKASMDFLDLSAISYAEAEESSLEITAKGIHKGQGLLDLTEMLNIKLASTIAVGDAENDRQILQTAGLGIAMGNATPAIKAIADVTVADYDHDGCAQAIYQFLLK